MKPEKLVTMANQIGAFFASQKGDEAVHSIVDHLKKFWDPRMRAAILAHLEAGGEGLEPRCAALSSNSPKSRRLMSPQRIDSGKR